MVALHRGISVLFFWTCLQCIGIVTFGGGPILVHGENIVYTLGKLNLNPKTVTVSGFSAGSSMATQIHVAHSSEIRGAALFSQAYYRCGPNSWREFGIRCSNSFWDLIPYDVESAIQDARLYSKFGFVDNTDNLKNHKVFIWTGDQDEYLSSKTVSKNQDFYKAFISNPDENIKLTVANAKHLFPTDSYGAKCSENAEKNLYLGNCNYSGAAHALKFLLGDTIQSASVLNNQGQKSFDEDQLMLFDQTEFYHGNGTIKTIGMGTIGQIYVPKACTDSTIQCHIHFNFHGCNEWPLNMARPYALNNGFLPVAERNRIVVVFPLTTAIPSNQNGCWDFFSYTDRKFATKEGAQIQVVYRILQRLLNGN